MQTGLFMLELTFDLTSLPNAGKQIAALMKVKLPLLLYGEMGAGKTTLTKAIIQALGNSDEVTSPTFNIMLSYDTQNATLWHVDLYRLETGRSIQELGLDELNWQNLLIIEWPERLGQQLFTPHLKGILSVLANGHRHLIVERSDA